MQATLTPSTLSAARHVAESQRVGLQDAARLALATPALESNELLRGQKTVQISHNGSLYRLQATRLGKLILTK